MKLKKRFMLVNNEIDSAYFDDSRYFESRYRTDLALNRVHMRFGITRLRPRKKKKPNKNRYFSHTHERKERKIMEKRAL